VWRGPYSAITAYVTGDLVSFGGSTYFATGSTTGTAPPAAPWNLVAQVGATGATGATGAPGASPSADPNAKGCVNHGATAGTARPTWAGSIEWYGSVTPTNAIAGDTWVKTA
jgi:hypothetical protein